MQLRRIMPGHWIAIAALFLAGAVPRTAAQATGASLPLTVHAGTVVSLERLEKTVDWIDLDEALLRGYADPEDVKDDVLIRRPPRDAHCYAVWTLELVAGRTVSRFDYQLHHDTGVSPCVAMQRGTRPYDLRVLELAGPDQVSLLFEVPGDTQYVTLEFALATTVPQPSLQDLPFGQAATAAALQAPDEAPALPAVTPTDGPPPPEEPRGGNPPAEATPKPAEPKPEPTPAKPPKPKDEDDLGDLF